jgi:hypothetical protein
VRHGRRFGATDYVEVDFETIFFHHPRLFEDVEKRQMGRITGEQIEGTKHRFTPFYD